MIHNIRSEFINILEESNWMDEETKSVAKEKVTSTRDGVGQGRGRGRRGRRSLTFLYEIIEVINPLCQFL